MKNSLKISSDLSLPLELAARTQCIFAQKGAGKTYAAGVMTEEMLGAGVQVCVLDPTGVWWGLQSSADGGKSPYEIIVMGGGHADVPLEPDAGEIVANFLVDSGQSVVLDVSQFESQAAQDRFALALATKLYRLKAHDRENIHIVLDEADQFCPMKPQHGQERLVHAWDLIVRLGRSRGLGLTAISQRPAVVHTNIRNNVDLLTCLRVVGPHDFKALKEWTGIYATPEQSKEFLESVPTLADGEAFFWSPSWLKIFERAKIRTKKTFDSSRTPKPGERAIKPTERRAPDLSKLSDQIKASVQKAKSNDPTELKKKLAEAERALAKAVSEKKTEQVVKHVVTDAQVNRVETIVSRLEKEGNRRIEAAETLRTSGEELKRTASEFTAALRHASAPTRPIASTAIRPVPAPAKIDRRASLEAVGDLKLDKCHRSILSVLSQFPEGCKAGKICLLAGYTYGGNIRNHLSDLRTGNLIVGGNTEMMQITEAGSACGPFEELPQGEALIEFWLNYREFDKCHKAILRALIVNPNGLDAQGVCAAAGYEWGGNVRNHLSDLRTAGVLIGKNTERMKASDELLAAV